MNKEILEQIRPLIGKQCCRAAIGEFKSLSLGFGEKIYHRNPKLRDTYYGEWEIGTYQCAWRVMEKNKILLGKNDTQQENVLDNKLKRIRFGRIASINQITDLDIRLSFDNEMIVDFFATISDDDEYFHIFCPDNMWIGLLPGGKWIIRKSDKPPI